MAGAVLGRERSPVNAIIKVSIHRFNDAEVCAFNRTLCPTLDVMIGENVFDANLPSRSLYLQIKMCAAH